MNFTPSHRTRGNGPTRPPSPSQYFTRTIYPEAPRAALDAFPLELTGHAKPHRKRKTYGMKRTRTASRWSWIESFAPRCTPEKTGDDLLELRQ